MKYIYECRSKSGQALEFFTTLELAKASFKLSYIEITSQLQFKEAESNKGSYMVFIEESKPLGYIKQQLLRDKVEHL